MKIISLLLFSFFCFFPFSNLQAQSGSLEEGSAPSPPKHGCKTINIHCKCVNPTRDFTVKNHKVGKVNPGEPGQCRPKLDIDEFLKQDALGYCLPDVWHKDPSKPTSKCVATWTCVAPCTYK